MSGADMLKLLDTSTIKGKEGQEDVKDICPRCPGKVNQTRCSLKEHLNLSLHFQVFHAESVPVKDRAYHQKCCTCATCNKPLSSKDICTGKDNDIYCKSCYARKFGAPGYRGESYHQDKYCYDWGF